MLKALKKLSFENFKKSINMIFNRFPLSAIISIAALGLMLMLIRFEDVLSQPNKEIILKTFVTLAITFFFSVAIYLFTESKGFKGAKKFYYQLISFVFGALFYYFFEEGLFSGDQAETVVYILLTIIGVIAFLFIAKYFQKLRVIAEDHDEFYVSSYILVLKTIMSIIVGVSTFILGMIAIQSVFVLFDLEFVREENWFAYWASFSLILFASFFFLANLPTAEESKTISIAQIAANKFFSFLINYVGLPAILIYFVILYSYTVKVLVNFSDWPHGEVSWMVILFSFFGYIMYFASFAFRDTLKQVKLFRKILPIAVILQTPMLFYAIGLRINQYDFTINRYLVLVFGGWLLYLSLYYIFSKQKHIFVSFYSLLVVVVLMSIGPWSVYLMPERRQLVRLEKNLQIANILQDNNVVPLENYTDIDAKLGGDIYGGIEYLANFHGYETLENLFAKEILEIEKNDKEKFEKNKKENLERLEKEEVDEDIIKRATENNYNGLNNWELINGLTEHIKVGRWNNYTQGKELKYWRFENTSNYHFSSNIMVSGYDYYIPLIQDKDEIDNILSEQKTDYDIEENIYFAIIDSEEAKISLYLDEELLEEVDIKESIINKILNNQEKYLEPKYQNPNLRAALQNEDMSFTIDGKKFDMMVVLQSISIQNPNWTKESESEEMEDQDKYMMRDIGPMSPYSSGYVLIKEKPEVESNLVK